MSSTILDNFNKLKSDNNSVRLDAGVALLSNLCHNTNQDDNKELDFALVRLVRGLGASKLYTRKGFYTTLTSFLMLHPQTSVEKLLSIVNSQLHPAGGNSKSENADIYTGRILFCGALIRSKLLAQSPVNIQQQVVEILLNASKERSYLLLISIVFLHEFIAQIDTKSMKKAVWPFVEKELSKPWSEHTLDTFYMLLAIRDKHSSLVNHEFLKEHLGVEEIIAKESMAEIVCFLTSPRGTVSSHHPVFKLFCEKLLSTRFLTDFWKAIDNKFAKLSANDECVATEVVRLIFSNVTDKTVIPLLLSPNLLQHMLNKFSSCKKNNNDKVLIAFKEILNLVASATSDKDVKTKTQLDILKKLVLHPGDLMIEKKTGTKVIQIITGNLKLDGITKLCQLYRDIIENKLSRDKEDTKIKLWTNAERSYAAQLLTRLMGHRETFMDQNWRLEQLKFLFSYGLCEMPNVGIELASQFKDSFYRALDHKLPKLNDARNLLNSLVQDLNSELQSNEIRLRSPLNDAAANAWKRVIDTIGKLRKSTKNADVLFHTMNLHMGLQLFSNPEMAIASINELQCCYERSIKKSKVYKKLNNATAEEEEPEWVEVVVDLLLSLLSRDNHLLRSIVGCVFPHISPYLTPSAVYQIIDVLNVQNDQNPLTTKQSNDEDSSSIETESDDDDDDDDNDDDDNDDEKQEEDTSNGEVLSEISESESENDVDEDDTVNDKLRMAVRQALGDAAIQTDDEDIDIDQIGEEEGKRLDESLAAAFKILRENRKARSKKQGKTNQALTHFRIRVIDLLDIYLETCPSMAVTLDLIVPLFNLLEFCIKDPHQKPLEHRVRSCLKKLSTVKKVKDTTGVDDSLITTVLRGLLEKGERSALVCQEISDKLAECCTFVVRCAQQANLSTVNVVKIYGENLVVFFKKRDFVLSSILFKNVLQLCWEDNWLLASLLVNFAFDSNIRYFRRSEALELLLILYNNNRLLHMDSNKYAEERKELERTLCKNTIDTLEELSDSHVSDNGQVASCNGIGVQKKVLQKFVGHLLILLRAVYANHLPEEWDWEAVKTALTTYKSRNVLSRDTKSAYNKLAVKIGASINVPLVSNKTNVNNSTNINPESNSKQNNVTSENGKTSDSEEEKEEQTANGKIQKKKNKNKQQKKETQLLKRETRELRAKAMSENLELFKFSNVNLPRDENTTDIYQNGDLHNESTNTTKSQKRNYEKIAEGKQEPKKRKKSH